MINVVKDKDKKENLKILELTKQMPSDHIKSSSKPMNFNTDQCGKINVLVVTTAV